MITIQPSSVAGEVVLLNNDGEVVGEGFARASRLLPGYVTVVAVEEREGGAKVSWVFRVPADWFAELGALQSGLASVD